MSSWEGEGVYVCGVRGCKASFSSPMGRSQHIRQNPLCEIIVQPELEDDDVSGFDEEMNSSPSDVVNNSSSDEDEVVPPTTYTSDSVQDSVAELPDDNSYVSEEVDSVQSLYVKFAELYNSDDASDEEDGPGPPELEIRPFIPNLTHEIPHEDGDDKPEESGRFSLLNSDKSNSYSNATPELDRNDRAGLRLLALLDKSNASLYVYDAVTKWIEEEGIGSNDTPLDLREANLPCRSTLLSHLIAHYDLASLAPFKNLCYLPGSKKVVEVTCHQFEANVKSLLDDKNLMKKENLNLDDPEDPTYFHTEEPELYTDVHTGSAFRSALWKCKDLQGNIVLIPIIIFIDATVIDVHGRMRLEPVTFTLAIFNYETRMKPEAWRTLGFIRSVDSNTIDLSAQLTKEQLRDMKLPSKKDDRSKKSSGYVPPSRRDYHAILYCIMDGVRKVHKKGGLYWKFTYDGIKEPDRLVLVKFPVLFIMGDTEGHNKLCALVGGASAISNNPLCRYCTCKKDDTDNPDAKRQHIKTPELQKLIRDGKTDRVRKD
jgi:hypothetical protein